MFAPKLRIPAGIASQIGDGIPRAAHFRYSECAGSAGSGHMSGNKTQPTDVDTTGYIATLEPARRRQDAARLDTLFREVTGFAPRMWGASIIGYGRYAYRYDSGRTGAYLATGFAPRKSAQVIYIMPGYADFSHILADLGKHRMGKSCLYIKTLSDVDQAVLARLIRAGLDDLNQKWPVRPS